jgi:hypothetical protein
MACQWPTTKGVALATQAATVQQARASSAPRLLETVWMRLSAPRDCRHQQARRCLSACRWKATWAVVVCATRSCCCKQQAACSAAESFAEQPSRGHDHRAAAQWQNNRAAAEQPSRGKNVNVSTQASARTRRNLAGSCRCQRGPRPCSARRSHPALQVSRPSVRTAQSCTAGRSTCSTTRGTTLLNTSMLGPPPPAPPPRPLAWGTGS